MVSLSFYLSMSLVFFGFFIFLIAITDEESEISLFNLVIAALIWPFSLALTVFVAVVGPHRGLFGDPRPTHPSESI